MQKIEKSSTNNRIKENINIPGETNDTAKDIVDNSNKISDRKTIPVQTLMELFRAGFRKLVPLFGAAKTAKITPMLFFCISP